MGAQGVGLVFENNSINNKNSMRRSQAKCLILLYLGINLMSFIFIFLFFAFNFFSRLVFICQPQNSEATVACWLSFPKNSAIPHQYRLTG